MLENCLLWNEFPVPILELPKLKIQLWQGAIGAVVGGRLATTG